MEKTRKRKKEMLPSTSGEKVENGKIDEMKKLITNLSVKSNRMEMENKS